MTPSSGDVDAARQAIAALRTGNVACVQTTDNDLQAFAELPDCEACDGSGKQVPEGWCGASGAAPEPAPAVDLHSGPENVSGSAEIPEPDGDGPGWDRDRIGAVGFGLRLVDRRPDLPVYPSPGDADQIRALLADRDELARRYLATWRQKKRAEQERNAVRAEMDGPCRPDCDCPHEPMHICYCHMTRDQLIQEIDQREEQRDEARDELAKVDAILHRHGIHHPGGSQGVLDLAGLVVDAKEEAETARRDGAADALAWASDQPLSHGRLRQWAAHARSGRLEIPARQDGDDDE